MPAADGGWDAGAAMAAVLPPGDEHAGQDDGERGERCERRDSDRFVINVVFSSCVGGLTDEHRSGQPLRDPISSYGDRAGLSRRRG